MMFVWKESVYRNKFKCCKCGALLMENNKPTENLGVNVSEFKNKLSDSASCYCKKCNDFVATLSDKTSKIDAKELQKLNGNVQEVLEKYSKKTRAVDKKINELNALKLNYKNAIAENERIKRVNINQQNKIADLESKLSNLRRSFDKTVLDYEHRLDEIIKAKEKEDV